MQVRLAIRARHDQWLADLLLRCGATVRPSGDPGGSPWTGACLSDIGCARETNEDCCVLVLPAGPDVAAAKGVLAIVADGMGGHQAGEVASSMAVNIVCREYFDTEAPPREALIAAFQRANDAIYKAGRQDGSRDMGTTCTALAIIDRKVFWAHIGDSRLYRLRRGRLIQLTEDDSEVGSLIRSGWMSVREARRHPQRNLLSRALGLDPEIQPAAPSVPSVARWGDIYLLCSDGLHDVLELGEIERIVAANEPPTACGALIALARARGGPDNISAVIVGTQEGRSASTASLL